MSCRSNRLLTTDFACRFPLRVVGASYMHKMTFSYSSNQPNDFYYSIGNVGEFNVCVKCDETRVAIAFYSPPFSRAVFCSESSLSAS
jgi:hypothetical protein